LLDDRFELSAGVFSGRAAILFPRVFC
jgi:hypothetical protein